MTLGELMTGLSLLQQQQTLASTDKVVVGAAHILYCRAEQRCQKVLPPVLLTLLLGIGS
jgi:hypothetical protein